LNCVEGSEETRLKARVLPTAMFDNIRGVAMDVDGVFTDGTVWWGTNGEEYKRYCYADVTGVPRALKAGLHLALISGESSPGSMALVEKLADKLKIPDVYKGCQDKAGAVRDFAQKRGLQLSEICFVGDDIQDIPAMSLAGVAAVPANAQPAARAVAHFVAVRDGGFGVVREILDAILEAQLAARENEARLAARGSEAQLAARESEARPSAARERSGE
jgi:3-deoxy-D-manno-octulosonate 8-phosphate phosphatase (KDO 8-P phosphatase)